VVDLVALLETAQDRDRVVDVRLADEDRLEAPLERRILLDLLSVLVEGRRADGAQLAAGEHRLQQVGGVDRALGGTGADDRVQLVDEEDDLALGVLDLGEHGLEPLLELAAVLRAGEERADVERDHAPVAQRLGDVAGDDPLGEAFDDRRLADPRVADQDRVVLGPPREDLDHPADLLVAADDRVELAGSRIGGQVAAELLQRLHRLLRIRGGDTVRPPRLGDRLDERLALGKDVGDARCLVGEREQDVLDRDELVAERGHLLLGPLEDANEPLRRPELRLGVAAQRRQVGDRGPGALGDRADVGGELAQDRGDEAVLLLEDGDEEVRRADLGVARLRRELLRGGDRLLGPDREPVRLHSPTSLAQI
jgi:hypothetical protein